MYQLLPLITLMILSPSAKASEEKRSLIAKLEDRFEAKLGEASLAVTKWLEAFNDRHLAGSELGKLIQYEKIKPTLEEASRSKKMSLAMMPMIFHIGATSTWMLLTAIMATKSVLIGVTLLVFKIAVSAAKLSSFFTTLKDKKHHEWSPPVYYEHSHGYARSMPFLEPAHIEAPPSYEGYYPSPSHGGYSAGPPSSHSAPSSYSSPSSHSSSSYYSPSSSHSGSSSYSPSSSYSSSSHSGPSSQSQEWIHSEPAPGKGEHSTYYYK